MIRFKHLVARVRADSLLQRLPVLAGGVFCGLCAGTAMAGMITGTASYRERMLLPPDAVFTAELLDVSLADAPADLLARGVIRPAGQTPFNFRIAYDDDAILAGRTYVVRASVHHDGRLLFTSDSRHRVLDGGSAPLLIPMVRVRAEAPPPTPEGVATAMTGRFIYQADAALFTDCATGRRVPVAMAGDYAALERAYLAARGAPGELLTVRVQGHLAERPSAEETNPPVTTLVVDHFDGIDRTAACAATAGAPGSAGPDAAALPDQPLRNTYWKLLALAGQPVGPDDFQREPHIVFAHDEGRVHGSGGCNGFFGGFEQPADGRLKMSRMASTMMACMQGMPLEHRFLRTLERVDGYRISGGTLTLLAADGAELARLEAVALR